MRRRRYLTGVGTSIGLLTSTAGYGRGLGAEPVSLSIVETNDPVDAGDVLEVTVEVENESDEDVRPAIEFYVGEDHRITKEVTVGAGETDVVEFGHLTFPVRSETEFTVRVDAGTDSDERTVRVRGVADVDGVVRPDGDLTVSPGTSVLFEVASDVLGEYGGATTWYLDGAYAGSSMGPWYAAYYADQGRDHWRYTFEAEGTHRVAAAVVGEDGNRTAHWTVEVAEGGAASPTVESVRPDPGALEVDGGETVDLEADVTDPDGRLDRVVWWLGHADVILGTSDVDGAADTASLSVDGAGLCEGCPIVIWVCTADGTFASGAPWTVHRHHGEPTSLSIVGTNEPVAAGEHLEVTAELENGSADEVSRAVDLVVSGERVDGETVAVGPGETASVGLGYETYPVRRNVEFPVRVESDDDVDQRPVRVFADGVGPVEVTILETNAPVQAGEVLEVTAALENGSDEGVSREVRLVAGDRVAAETVAIPPGETRTVALGYETHPVETDVEFPVRVECDGGADDRLVEVFADGVPTRVSILETNAPVQAGEVLEVTAEVENPGGDAVTRDVDFVVGSERVDSESVTVAAGGTATLVLGYETYPVERDVEFPVRVESDDADERLVEVVAGRADHEREVRDVSFESCRRGTVTGTFLDGDTISASTGWHDSTGFADTIREDWLTIGEHVPAPFSGTITFAVGDERGVSGGGGEAAVTVPDYGDFGTAIAGIRTPEASPGRDFDYENPHDCRAAIRPDRPGTSVEAVEPQADGTLVVGFGYVNAHDVPQYVGGHLEGSTADEPPSELSSPTGGFSVEWTPASDDERLVWVLDLSGHGYAEPIRTETEPAGAYRPDAEGDLAVSITSANDPVEGGEVLEVTAQVENVGAAAASGSVELVVAGDDVVATESVTLAGDEATTVTLGYETFPVEQDVSFDVTVRTGDDSDSRTVDVLAADGDSGDGGEGSLAVSITGANDPVDAGEVLEVTAEVGNVGGAAASGSIELVVGGEVVDANSVTLGPGESTAVSLGYHTAVVEQDVTFPVTVRSGDDAGERSVQVFGDGS